MKMCFLYASLSHHHHRHEQSSFVTKKCWLAAAVDYFSLASFFQTRERVHSTPCILTQTATNSRQPAFIYSCDRTIVKHRSHFIQYYYFLSSPKSEITHNIHLF